MKKRVKIMTGALFVVLLVILAGIVLGSRPTSLSRADLDARAREELGEDVECAGSFEKNDKALFWFIAGERQERRYLALDCRLRDGGYQLLRVRQPQADVQQVVHLSWGEDYSFLIDQPDCRRFQLTDGKQIIYETELGESTAESGFPYPLLVEDLPRRFAYIALDGQGEKLPD